MWTKQIVARKAMTECTWAGCVLCTHQKVKVNPLSSAHQVVSRKTFDAVDAGSNYDDAYGVVRSGTWVGMGDERDADRSGARAGMGDERGAERSGARAGMGDERGAEISGARAGMGDERGAER
jgi:hypothetical protein